MDRREFVKTAGTAGAAAAMFPGLAAGAYRDAARQRIRVNVPTYTTELYGPTGEKIEEYRCRVGHPDTPTPVGDGEVFAKKDDVIFTDDDGELITETELKPEGRTVEVPYEDVRALWFTINGRMTGPIFHSTLWYWTIGTPSSDGCVALELEDMKDLYEKVEEPLPDLDVTYDTMFLDEEEDRLRLYADVYGRGSNSLENLSALLDRDIPARDETVRDRLDAIDRELDEGLEHIFMGLDEGRDVRPERDRLYYDVAVSTLVRNQRII